MKHIAFAIAFAGFAATPLTAHPSHAPNEESHRQIMVVLAHPDDELVMAPALAGLVRAGHELTLVYATDGDQGPGVSGKEPGRELGQTRRAEAECAADALGGKAIFLDGIRDGTLTQQPREDGSPAKRFMDDFAYTYLANEPDVVMTWGPDGGYGHGDHQMVSALVTTAVQSLRDAPTRPQLLYPALIHSPLPEPLEQQGWSTTAPDLAKVNYRYNDADLAAANAAAQCHKTQFDDATRAMIVPGFDQGVWKGAVSFRSAF